MKQRTASAGRAGWVRDLATVYAKGLAMGVADAIPGVSGGTIALITGIYDRLIEAIAGLSEDGPTLVASLVEGDGPGRVASARTAIHGMDLPFLVVLGLGVVTGVVTLANVIDVALEVYRAPTFAFFFGVILASPVVLRDEVTLRRPQPLVAGVAGFLLAFVVAGLPYRDASYSLPAVFLIGAVAISAMVLPGISGSLVLLIIGAYEGLTGAVRDLTGAAIGVAGGGGIDAAIEPLSVLLVFAAGAFVGVLTFARLVSRALDANRVATMTFLVGVMIGALRTPVREIADSVPSYAPTVLLSLVAAAVVGAIVVLVLEVSTGGIE